jgi:DNA polymerase-3 subunit alpha
MRFREGLIVSSACLAGEVAKHVMAGANAEAVAARFKAVFGDDYYLEVMDNYMQSDDQRKTNVGIIALAKKMGIKVIPTNDAHYLREQDQKLHDVAICMQTKKSLKDPDRMKYDGVYHLKTPEEMKKLFGEFIANTEDVASKVEAFEIFAQEMSLPIMSASPNEELEQMARAGMARLTLVGEPQKKEYEDRLRRELDTIFKLKMSGYFLAMKEIVNLIRGINCPIGWGRGSAGGSLVCYALDITDIDPIRYDLLFERFINEYRKDWPDIDIDVPQSRRKEIIEKITERFGEKCVAHISTVQYLKPKMLLRDICRVLSLPVSEAN